VGAAAGGYERICQKQVGVPLASPIEMLAVQSSPALDPARHDCQLLQAGAGFVLITEVTKVCPEVIS
jgi:hypothetical protein